MSKWNVITIKYQYADGTPSEVTKEAFGKKAINKEIDYISKWLKSHNRTVTEVTVTEAN